ncbi:MAG: UDP-2,3-diacylglucosamine diphosphatase LpxI [Hyphomonadaceae bacterium]|nr:UDP-2,3-diacylglucosamine diphosphatase LpxI [Hyphomonadaceae bacterium]
MTKLGIIAGGGALPRTLAEHARATSRPVYILGLRGFADPALWSEFGGAEAAMGEIGKGIRLLRDAGCKDVVFAGTIKRPELSDLKFDFHGATLLPELAVAAGKGDDALLRVVLGAFEKAGFRIIGADDVLGNLLAPTGPLGSLGPSQQDWVDIRKAAEAAAAIGAKDVGQGAVSRNGAILATETQDGTDAMLRRVAEASAGAKGGVLVKRPKPQQERRIDLPTIGVQTLRGAHAAGLSGIVVEAGGALVMNRAELQTEADRLGLFVYGASPGELA